MTTAAEIAAALGGIRSGNGWKARCPAHDDHTPSLSVTDREGRVLFYCHAGCGQRVVIAALRERGLFPVTESQSRPDAAPSRGPDHTWHYCDAAGVVVRRTARWNLPDRKVIRPQVPDGSGGWRMGEMRGPRPLYRLHGLLARRDAPILVVEGERTADAAAAILSEYRVTTSSGGAHASAQSDWSPLQGRRVIVWRDADDPGAQYAADVARLAREANAAEVCVVQLPDGLPNGWDLADPLPEGWSVDTVSRLLVGAQPAADGVDDTGDSVTRVLADAGLLSLSDSPQPAALEGALRNLAKLLRDADPLRLRVTRNAVADLLKTKNVTSPVALVDAAFGTAARVDTGGGQGQALTLADPEPWPGGVDGAELLDEIRDTFKRFIALPAQAAVALALWVLHTHAIKTAYLSPLLAITSPQKRCGKTTLLEVLACLVRRPLSASNVTAAALFRVIEAREPTLLVDEADTFLAKHEELRGILDSGHTRSSAQVVRTVGDNHEPRIFRTFGAKAIAAIGALSGTLEDRAVVIHMHRRAAGERVERIRRDRIEGQLLPLRRQAARWVVDHVEGLRTADPATPSTLHDRAADNWRPLLAIAEAAGGHWPALARAAAVALSASGGDDSEAGVMMLADLRSLFDARGAERLASASIVDHLSTLEGRPWPDWRRDKPINQNGLARLLKPFGVRPKTVRIGTETPKGYERPDFEEAWKRYLPAGEGTFIRNTATNQAAQDQEADLQPQHTGDMLRFENTRKFFCDNDCGGVADENRGSGDEERF
jgi:hypothetical protein